ncbi:MAG: alkaline phosphatase family protein [Vulcanimicrobiaceae bacterium]
MVASEDLVIDVKLPRLTAAVLSLCFCSSAFAAAAVPGARTVIPTGQAITPTAAPGALFERLANPQLRPDGNADADDAVATALSPDGTTLVVLTSGFNVSVNDTSGRPLRFPVLDPLTGLPDPSVVDPNVGGTGGYNQAEFAFVYDVTRGTPSLIERIPITDTYNGLVWDPSGTRFYVSGGIDDRILAYKRDAVTAQYVPDAPFVILGHNSNDTAAIPAYDGGILKNTPAGRALPALVTGAVAAGFDVSRDGKTLVVANFENASATIADAASRKVVAEVAFTQPGSRTPIGEFPFWVSVKSTRAGAYEKAYVSSQRDDQVVVMQGAAVSKVITVPAGPNKMTLSPDGKRLYVACGNDDSIAVIDTLRDSVVDVISLARPGYRFKGANPNSVALAPGGETLYVTLGGENAVAVVDLRFRRVIGRVPTGWLPTSVTVSADGKMLYVCNEKSNSGPNPAQVYYSYNTAYGTALNAQLGFPNQYTWETEKAGLLSLPVPSRGELASLSRQVDANDGFEHRGDDETMEYLRTKIKHVLYIVNENRTYDQVLGDLGNGANGDPRLTFFTDDIAPNLHALARDYVTLDNFYDSSESSGVGWNWVMQGHTNDFTEKTQSVQYGNSNGLGLTYDWQGIVANVNLGLRPTGGSSIFDTRITGVLDPSGGSTILPGSKDPVASEGANDLAPGAIGGYVWEAALRARKSVRNYGWQDDLTYYGTGTPYDPKLVRHPFENQTLQAAPSTPSIQPITDRYYRAFDQRYPDIYRYEEWKREFDEFVKNRTMPALTTMTLPHDHFGSLKSAIAGLNTPELEMADHDYAVGKVVEAVSHSPYWPSTAIVMIEDDPQDGQDHVDAHRSIAHVVSAYTRRGFIDHSFYTTVNALRTVEELLGLPPLGLNDANARPMSTVFSKTENLAAYEPKIPGLLCTLAAQDLVPACASSKSLRTRSIKPLHDATWWDRNTRGFNTREPDHVNGKLFNRILRFGIRGTGSLPSARQVARTKADAD